MMTIFFVKGIEPVLQPIELILSLSYHEVQISSIDSQLFQKIKSGVNSTSLLSFIKQQTCVQFWNNILFFGKY